jgi:uncharacterized protein (TIGR03437 family)
VKGSAKLVTAGSSLTINGNGFGSTQCSNCKVTSTAGSATAQTMTIASWSATAIAVTLPSTTGLLTLTVTASSGADSFNVMAISATPAIGATPTSMQFTYTAGGAVPAAQTIQITNSGGGTLNWSASVTASWLTVTPTSGTAPSAISVSIVPAGLSMGSYQDTITVTASGASNTPLTVPVTLTVQAAPTGANISSVLNGASFQAGFASATWVSIFGTNLSSTTRGWQSSDFVNGALPTSLDGVSVTINGLAAYVAYISPTQMNVLAPDDAMVGAAQVQVTAGGQQSNSFTAQKTQFAPAFFTIAGSYAAAQHADSTLVGSANLIPGVTTQPAAPGEVIVMYGTGFGPANPSVPTGQLVSAPSILANDVQVTIGGVSASVAFAGVVQSGLYQFNVTVPDLPDGDAPLAATVGGVQTQAGVLLTVAK